MTGTGMTEAPAGIAVADDTVSVVLAGVGGQGILLASTVIARAAMYAGLDTKTNEVHGMAQRGGSVVAQIRFGSCVHSPLVPLGAAGAIGALEAVEALRYANLAAPGALAVVSTQRIVPVTVSSGQSEYPADLDERLKMVFPRLVLVDAAGVAIEAGHVKAANMVVVGAMSAGLALPPEAWRKAVESSVPSRHVQLNLDAFERGRALGAVG